MKELSEKGYAILLQRSQVDLLEKIALPSYFCLLESAILNGPRQFFCTSRCVICGQARIYLYNLMSSEYMQC